VDNAARDLLEKFCEIAREADELGLTKPAKRFIVLARRGQPGMVSVRPPVASPQILTDKATLQGLADRGYITMKEMPSGAESFLVTQEGLHACEKLRQQDRTALSTSGVRLHDFCAYCAAGAGSRRRTPAAAEGRRSTYQFIPGGPIRKEVMSPSSSFRQVGCTTLGAGTR
jgi:hypothetical protein